MARRKTRKKAAKKGYRHVGSGKAALSIKRGHKPVSLLKTYHSKMVKNVGRLENLIKRREAAGE